MPSRQAEPMSQRPDREALALERLDALIAKALRAGAEAADAVAFEGTSLSASQRLGEIEDIQRSEASEVGLRVFIGHRQAIVSSSDTSRAALDELVERALAMARAAPEDPYCGLADGERLAKELPELDLYDAAQPSVEELFDRVARAEDAALAVPGITNSEGAEASWHQGLVALAASHGFAGAYTTSSHSVAASVVAGKGSGMERDYDYASARHAADLEDPRAVGERAGQRAVRRLEPRKVSSARLPVVFDPRVSGGLLRHLVAAVSGAAVARGTSFLMDMMEKPVFAPGISVVDDARRGRGLRSRPFDGEGVATERRKLVDDGRLVSWLLDSASARQLGLATTGHASRSAASVPSPSPSNLYLEAGPLTPQELMSDIAQGFYVTELSGFGVNPVTGDYSRGAAGFWIENGELGFAVSEITIAGNLKAMFRALKPADDLDFRYGIDAPTLHIDGMTLAGK